MPVQPTLFKNTPPQPDPPPMTLLQILTKHTSTKPHTQKHLFKPWRPCSPTPPRTPLQTRTNPPTLQGTPKNTSWASAHTPHSPPQEHPTTTRPAPKNTSADPKKPTLFPGHPREHLFRPQQQHSAPLQEHLFIPEQTNPSPKPHLRTPPRPEHPCNPPHPRTPHHHPTHPQKHLFKT